jgi:hypothetical protein
MSASLAAARKRRINTSQSEPNMLPQTPSYGQNVMPQTPSYGQNVMPQTPSYGQNTQSGYQTTMPSQNSGLTLPQVISLVDKRLITLEQFMKQQSSSSTGNNVPSNITAIVDEFNTRFTILAEEIDSIKNILMKLQAFTMDVNKNLLDERVRIFSDVDNINSSLDIKRNIDFANLENIKDFSPKMNYLEQTGEFSMSKEFENYNNKHNGDTS